MGKFWKEAKSGWLLENQVGEVQMAEPECGEAPVCTGGMAGTEVDSFLEHWSQHSLLGLEWRTGAQWEGEGAVASGARVSKKSQAIFRTGSRILTTCWKHWQCLVGHMLFLDFLQQRTPAVRFNCVKSWDYHSILIGRRKPLRNRGETRHISLTDRDQN